MKKEKTVKTAEQKKEIKKNIGTALLAFVAIVAVVAVGVFYFQSHNGDTPNGIIKQEVSSLDDITLSEKVVSVPYVPTDIPSVAYTANTAGEIKFFEFNGTDYVETAETGNMAISVPLSNQQIPVNIHFIERDGKLTGYGVFTSVADAGVYIYDFLLCKITNLPSAYEQGGKCLLLVNTDMASVYSTRPVWEEAYVLDRTNGSTSRFLSENNRMLGIDGAVRADFCMITDSLLTGTSSVIPFFSSRTYDVSDNTPYDLYIKQGNNETPVASNVCDKYAKLLEDGSIAYIRETNDGFNTVKYLDGKETVVSMYYSQYGGEYIRNGDWLLCKEDGRIFCTYNDAVIETPDFKINPMEFAISDDGKYVVMAGTVTNVLDYQIFIYNTETGKTASFSDEDYSAHNDLYFPSATTVCYYTIGADGYDTVIIDLSKI